MSHTTYTSRTGSPPRDLRPAPLRIPLRKPAASLDEGAVTAATQHRDGDRDTTASASRREDTSHHHHSDNITRALSHRRGLDSKLESLVSRFETLDAANTSEAQHQNSSSEARVTGPKQNPQQILNNNLPLKSMLSQDSSVLSPRQMVPLISFRRKSMIPVSAQPFTTIPATAHDHSDGNGASICPKVLDDTDVDMGEQQTSPPSSSYFASHSTVSSTSQQPDWNPSLMADRRKPFEGNSCKWGGRCVFDSVSGIC